MPLCSTLLYSTTHPYTTTPMESPSPSSEYPPAKRRKTSETDGHPVIHNSQMQQSPSVVATGSGNGLALPSIPKRGARACTACRKGKNRCEGEVSNQ